MSRWTIAVGASVLMIGPCMVAAPLAMGQGYTTSAEAREMTCVACASASATPPGESQYPTETSVMVAPEAGFPQLNDGVDAAAEDAETVAGAFGSSAESSEEQEPPTRAVVQASEEGPGTVPADPREPAIPPGSQTDGTPSSAPPSGSQEPKIVVLPETGGIGLGALLPGMLLVVGVGAALVRVLR